jgi:WD40 repeat protein/serine/threonine protein kinase
MSQPRRDQATTIRNMIVRRRPDGPPRPPVSPATPTKPERNAGREVPAPDDGPSEAAGRTHGSDEIGQHPHGTAFALDRGHTIGQYEIIRLLGHGGMGAVYLAHDLRLRRLVALKSLTAPWAGFGERFLAEARATARCHHENIVVIHEVGEHSGHPYMVLEYLEGQTLRQWLREHAGPAAASGQHVPVPPGRAVELMLPVVRALAYAHECGIVHRDLKPENIMLTRSGSIKVLDFGIAKLLSAPRLDEGAAEGLPEDSVDAVSGRVSGQAVAHSSALIGTLPYMSPEQMNVGVIDARSDLWSVGIMLFELVTGRHPVSSHDMADLLRVADEDAAMPSMRELMPGLGPLGAIIDRCLVKDPADRTPNARLLLAELETLAPSRRAALVGDDGNPFVGLAAFQEADADRFFGRDRDIDYILAELRSRPLVAVVGSSFVGKSSVIRAGVIPALKRSGEGWDTYVLRPGREPLAALASIVAQIQDTARSPAAIPNRSWEYRPTRMEFPMHVRLRAEPGHLGIQLRARASSKLRRVLLFVDQLEELYTLNTSPDDRAAFLACLASVADDASSPVRVLLTMRSDFFHRLAEAPHFHDEVTRGLVRLPPMKREGLCQALIRPVESCEFHFAPPTLVDRMVDALDRTPGALPLLQFTAARMWEIRDRDRHLLTEASYDQLGGVAGALASHADTVLTGMLPRDARLARAVFLRLVTPERTKALATLSELRALGQSPGDMDRVLARLIDVRLLAVELNTKGPGRTISLDRDDGVVEIVHESLIHTWPLLARWLDESAHDSIMLARLRSAARHWERSGHAAGLLWTGEAALEARAWHQRYRGKLAPAEQRYLAAVLAATEHASRVKRRLLDWPLLTRGVLAMAIALLARARLAWRRAKDRQSVPMLEPAPPRAIEDTSISPASKTEEAERLPHVGVVPAISTGRHEVPAASSSAGSQRIVSTSRDRKVRVSKAYGHGEPLVLRGHDDAVYSAAFSPDGQRVVSASLDKTVRVWNADGRGEPLILCGHVDGVVSVGFSPDGQRIVSASWDRTVRVWNADGSGEPLVLRGHEDAVYSAAFSSDGQRIVSASWDKTVRVWNADGRGEPLVLCGHQNMVSSAAFSPDGQRVVSASWDKTLRVWNADGSNEYLVLYGHHDKVYSAAFSPDGQRIVSASWDKTVRVWSANGRDEPLVLCGYDDRVCSTAFSPDGQRIVSASWDKTVRVWNADGRDEPLILRGHHAIVYSAAFSPDGQRIVSASKDKTVRVWNAHGRDASLVLRGQDDEAVSAALSPEGQHIVSASKDRKARLWNADGRGQPLVLRGHDDEVVSVAFSPDGQRIVSASKDKTVRVWNANGRGESLVLRGHDDEVGSAAFSPDGQRIVSTSWDKTVRVWNADGSGEPLVLRGHDDVIWSARFSPDGQHVVSASWDKTLRVWNADGRGKPLVLRGHGEAIWSAQFSPDGQRIVSASWDKTVRVWKADGRGSPLILRGHDDEVESATFSPDGQLIVSASWDKTVRVWNADGSGEPLVLSGHEDRVWSAGFSPDGQRIASASWDKTVRVWNADGNGEPTVLRGHGDRVWSAAFSPDGQRIVSASWDKTVRVWNADGSGEPLVLRGHDGRVWSAGFSPDGQLIVSASRDGTVRVWHVAATITFDDSQR